VTGSDGTVIINNVTVKGWSSGSGIPVNYYFGIVSNGIYIY
jgi:hypothetical protein